MNTNTPKSPLMLLSTFLLWLETHTPKKKSNSEQKRWSLVLSGCVNKQLMTGIHQRWPRQHHTAIGRKSNRKWPLWQKPVLGAVYFNRRTLDNIRLWATFMYCARWLYRKIARVCGKDQIFAVVKVVSIVFNYFIYLNLKMDSCIAVGKSICVIYAIYFVSL